MKLRFTPTAYADIDSVYDYIAAENPAAAQKTLDKIENMIDHLVDHPQPGKKGRVKDTRELIVPNTSFIIAYELNQETIDILAIIHSSRRWSDKLN